MLDNLMLFLIAVVNFSLITILFRLNTKHKDFFKQMEFGGILYGSASKSPNILDFFLKRQYIGLKDTFLTIMCNIFLVSFLISLPMMVVTVLNHK